MERDTMKKILLLTLLLSSNCISATPLLDISILKKALDLLCCCIKTTGEIIEQIPTNEAKPQKKRKNSVTKIETNEKFTVEGTTKKTEEIIKSLSLQMSDCISYV
jgi:hypothetical protein